MLNSIFACIFRLFKLDMVVWDEQGNVMNPLHTPILRMYENYKVTSAHVKNKEVRLSFDSRELTASRY